MSARALLEAGDADPGLALGRAQPNVPWTLRQSDRLYNLLIAGGQNSGKTSLLLRAAMNDALAPNTALVVFDMKAGGTLAERLLRVIPPDVPKRWYDNEARAWRDGSKRVWYLDLARPAFGLTPLHVDAGWQHATLAEDFARIADAIVRALLDLFPGQIMGSSEDLIERAVVGTMAIAWWEHQQRCDTEGLDPTTQGFSGSFEVLAQMFSPTDRLDDQEAENRSRRRIRPNRWHQAAGRACQMLPNLDQVADTLLHEIPRQARDNLPDIARRMEAPANKIRPLVGAATSVRRFVGHPERLSLRSVVEARDILIINPRVERIGEDQASILTNFVVHMLDLQLKRQIAMPAGQRPRVSLVIDEAHRLVTETLITMVATHREAGLTVAAALQYVSQLGANEPNAARREKILHGVGNLLQSKVLFRMSDSDDAEQHSRIFRSVYESFVRADPTSRARMPFDPSRMQTLRDHHAVVSLVSAGDPSAGGTDRLLDDMVGATRLPAFVTQTFPMPEVDEIPDTWSTEHLRRQATTFTRYPEDMGQLAARDVPAGLGGAVRPEADTEASATERAKRNRDAAEVARETLGKRPEVAPEAANDREVLAGADALRRDAADRGAGEHQPPAPPASETIGGVRIERGPPPPSTELELISTSPVLRHACRPTERPVPDGDLRPATEGAETAAREVAELSAITRLDDWDIAGATTQRQAVTAAEGARQHARAEAAAQGLTEDKAERHAEQRARRAAADVLRRAGDQPWRMPVGELNLSDGDEQTLWILARLRLTAAGLLGHLLPEPVRDRALRQRLQRLHDAGLIATSGIVIESRPGRRPRALAVTSRGLEYLRQRQRELRPDDELPAYLSPDRKLPSPGRGTEVPHELAMQLTIIALGQYGRRSVRMHWHTTQMPGGRWDVGMIHADRRDRTLTPTDLLPEPGLSMWGDDLSAAPTLEPDISVQLNVPARGGRAPSIIDMLIEVDRTGRGAYNEPKFTAYDHFLGGWALRTRRWGKERRTRPVVVFVAPNPRATLTLMHTADRAMTLGFGRSGHSDPSAFQFPGRAHTAFTCHEWLLAGQAIALQLPPLPPGVRGSETDLRPERVALLPEGWWPTRRRAVDR